MVPAVYRKERYSAFKSRAPYGHGIVGIRRARGNSHAPRVPFSRRHEDVGGFFGRGGAFGEQCDRGLHVLLETRHGLFYYGLHFRGGRLYHHCLLFHLCLNNGGLFVHLRDKYERQLIRHLRHGFIKHVLDQVHHLPYFFLHLGYLLRGCYRERSGRCKCGSRTHTHVGCRHINFTGLQGVVGVFSGLVVSGTPFLHKEPGKIGRYWLLPGLVCRAVIKKVLHGPYFS